MISVAFKEWAVICAALAAGKQALIQIGMLRIPDPLKRVTTNERQRGERPNDFSRVQGMGGDLCGACGGEAGAHSDRNAAHPRPAEAGHYKRKTAGRKAE